MPEDELTEEQKKTLEIVGKKKAVHYFVSKESKEEIKWNRYSDLLAFLLSFIFLGTILFINPGWIVFGFPFFIFMLLNILSFYSGRRKDNGLKIALLGILMIIAVHVYIIFKGTLDFGGWFPTSFVTGAICFYGYMAGEIFNKQLIKSKFTTNFDDVDFTIHHCKNSIFNVWDIAIGNIKLINKIKKVKNVFESQNPKGKIFDLGNYHYLLILELENYFISLIFEENGRKLSQDNCCKELKNKIDFIFKCILNFNEAVKTNMKKDAMEELALLINQYIEPSGLITAIEENKETFALATAFIVLIGGGLFVPRVVTPEQSTFIQTILVATISSLIGILLTVLFLARERKQL